MLEDLDAALLGCAGEAHRELSRVHQRVRMVLEHGTEVGRRATAACVSARSRRNHALFAASRGIQRPVIEPLAAGAARWPRRERPRAPSRPRRPTRRCRLPSPSRLASRGGRAGRSRRASGSARCLAVREAGFAEAAVATGCRPPDRLGLDQSTMRASGSRRRASSAVHNPVYPPPTITRSTS